MQQLIRGQKIKLSQLMPIPRLDIIVKATLNDSSDLDAACFGVDENEILFDDRYFIFYNQLNSPEHAIKKQADTTDHIFTLNLSKLATSIHKLVFTLAIDGNATMQQLGDSKVEILYQNISLAEYLFHGSDFQDEKAIVLAELYKKDDDWRLAIIGKGFNGGLDALLANFGGVEDVAPQTATNPTITPSTQTEPNYPEPPPFISSIQLSADSAYINIDDEKFSYDGEVHAISHNKHYYFSTGTYETTNDDVEYIVLFAPDKIMFKKKFTDDYVDHAFVTNRGQAIFYTEEGVFHAYDSTGKQLFKKALGLNDFDLRYDFTDDYCYFLGDKDEENLLLYYFDLQTLKNWMKTYPYNPNFSIEPFQLIKDSDICRAIFTQELHIDYDHSGKALDKSQEQLVCDVLSDAEDFVARANELIEKLKPNPSSVALQAIETLFDKAMQASSISIAPYEFTPEYGAFVHQYGDAQKAQSLLNQFLACPATDKAKARLLKSYGGISLAKNLKKEALSYFEKAIARDPNVGTKQLITKLKKELGQ